MSTQLGEAGAGARKIGMRRMIRVSIAIFACFIAGAILTYIPRLFIHRSLFFFALGLFIWGTGLGLLILAVYEAIFDKELDKQLDKAFKGAQAEVKVSEFLQGLPYGYAVINDLECPMGNIDHIVLGPTGMFMIETKSHKGIITLSRDERILLHNHLPFEKNVLKQMFNQLFWLRDELNYMGKKAPFIYALMVFTDAVVDVDKPIKNVSIINKDCLIEHITTKGGKLKHEDLRLAFYRLIKLNRRNEKNKTVRLK